MQPPFKLFGADLSPYSMKVRAYLRHKGLAHVWIPRSQATQAAFQKYARLPLIPVLVDASDAAFQDSTPIIERLEAAFPEPSTLPEDDAVRFIACLLEDYADEWVNKAMFHYRWTYEADQISAAQRIVAAMFGDGGGDADGAIAVVRERMTGRLHHVGSNAETAPVIEDSYRRLLHALETHLARRAYLFGERPSIGDFGLAAQLAQLASDPTPGAILRAEAPNTAAWVARAMDAPQGEGAFETLDSLHETLAPLLRAEIGETYLPWMAANADVMLDGGETLELDIHGQAFRQTPQKYAVRAYAELKRKRQEVVAPSLQALLEETGCARYLPLHNGAEVEADEAEDGED
jgi:glutathione S-transferase